MTIEKKSKVVTAGVVTATAVVLGLLIYRYRKYKNENAYYDNITQADIAWG